ncbi:MAG: hypothetical protein RIQ60_533 [Pseudomonadota bacterium]|jgi:hypothetical protein
MSDAKEPTPTPKGNDSFFRKVVRFVANPTTDWADLSNAQREAQENDYARSELKAMIERKRRNDFVRKREFDMLRKIRREGLTGDGLAGLENLSHLDDSEVRNPDGARPDVGVKEKIDAIEQQMVSESLGTAKRNAASVRATGPAMSESFFATSTSTQSQSSADAFKPTAPLDMSGFGLPTATSTLGPSTMSRPRVSVLSKFVSPPGDNADYTVEVTELAHDPELDEAVIAFANADFDQCERALRGLIGNGGARTQHSDTWFALFDLYRAIGQQSKFEALAMDYAQRFGWSAPQWFSLPKLVADAAASAKPRRVAGTSRRDSSVGWVAPATMDVEGVAQLRGQLLQMPLPWVLDWRPVRRMDAEASTALTRLLQDWADEAIEMRWLGGEQFLGMLAEAAPTGTKDADPAFWLLRLETMRLANQPVEFDQAAIDYCLTYEVSPPSWEAARCTLRITGATGVTVAPSTGMDVTTSNYSDTDVDDEVDLMQANQPELSGQLLGDISGVLKNLEAAVNGQSVVKVSCARLIRMDFIAAGDLLNWVLARRGENRSVVFEDAHRLVALFCGAMGINEHARVTVRNI